MRFSQEKIIVIVGPTASGKSDLALRLAKLAQGKLFKKQGIMGAEIISADSRQVYRGMDVGTGKVLKDKTLPVPNSKFKNQNAKLLKRNFYSSSIRHHLIDVANPKKQFAVSDFKKLGEKAIQDILRLGKLPIIVGGTGFYIDVLLDRIQIPEIPSNKKLREKLEKKSAEELFKKLLSIDQRRAQDINPKNKRKVIRALEIISTLGKVPKLKSKQKYDVLWLGIKASQEELNKKIKKRLDQRLKKGMAKELRNLIKSGVSYKRLYDFGLEYRQISEYLASKKFKVKSEKNFKNTEYYTKLLREIIKYSKRQMIWFRRNKEINWLEDKAGSERLIRKFLST